MLKNITRIPRSVSVENAADYFALFVVILISAAMNVLFIAVFTHQDIPFLAFLSIGYFVFWLLLLRFNYEGNHDQALLATGFGIVSHVSILTAVLGQDYGFQMFIWPTICIIAIHTQTRMSQSILFASMGFSVFIALSVFAPDKTSLGFFFDGYEFYIYSFCTISGGIPLILGMMSMKQVFVSKRKNLEEFANKDMLTKLYNRGFYYRELKRMIEDRRNRDSLGVLALGDLDNFKSINDDLGHEVGDKVLRRTARIIQGFLKPHDGACRWGGEEFVIYLHNCDLRKGEEIINTIRYAIFMEDFRLDGRDVTISFGLVKMDPSFSLEALMHNADKLLYEAKHAGRNQVKARGIL